MTEGETNVQYLPCSSPCFVCGKDNPAGLRTRFYVEHDVVKAKLQPRPEHCGYDNVVHGGVVAAILDETMGWAAACAIVRMCLTGDLNIRYLKPVPADRELTVTTEVTRFNRRLAHVKGAIFDSDGREYAQADGRFIPLSIKETLHVDDHLIYEDGDMRVFDSLR